MHRRGLRTALPALAFALVLLAAGLAAAHGWYPQQDRGYTEAHLMVQDCSDDWGVSHGFVDGHDLGGIYLREATGSEPAGVRVVIGMAAGYATEGGTGPRRVDITLSTPRVSTVLTLSTNDNKVFSLSGTNGVAPQGDGQPFTWMLPDGGGTDSKGRFGLEFTLPYSALKIKDGEAITGVGATSYVGTTKADFLPGGYYTTAGTYISSCPSNATSSAPKDRWFARESFVVSSSTWDGEPQTPAVPPAARFSFSPTSPRAGQEVSFTDQSLAGTSPITAWRWSFGDGVSTSERSPKHAYPQPGTYPVSLRVTASDGRTSESIVNLTVAAPLRPVADFSVDAASLRAGTPVAFTDRSTPGESALTSWAWDFGDGATATTRNATHAYANPGDYTVRLVVRDADGTSANATRNITIVATDRTPGPVADMRIEPSRLRANEPTRFIDASSPGGSPIIGWLWNFGDGGTSALQNPTRAYSEAGRYTVTLTVRAQDGQENTATREVTVGAANAAPVARIVAPATAVVGTPVAFDDASTDADGTIIAWEWDFGDGARANEPSPTHTFDRPGDRTVRLTVTDEMGATASATARVTVRAPSFSAAIDAPTTATVGESITVRDASEGEGVSVTAWSWNFGDGATATTANATHAYAEPGAYTIALDVTTSDGRTHSALARIEVTPAETTPTPTSAPTRATTPPPAGDDDTPAPALALVIGALGLVALARRRSR